MDFRQAPGKRIAWLDTSIEKHFSNFLYIDEKYGSNPVLRRIFSLARKHSYQSLLIDKITEEECALLAHENNALSTRRPDYKGSEVHRISFFKSQKGRQPGMFDFLGYVVFKRDYFSTQPQPRDHVFESVTPPFRQAEQNNFIHCQRRYEVNTSLGKFPVCGVLYAQQNDTTFVCAHVGLRSTLACILPDADISYERLNTLAGIDHKNRQVGNGAGLTPADIEKILAGLNLPFEKLVHEPSQQLNLPTDYQRYLYGFVESGFPALVGFELDDPNPIGNRQSRHAIPVFGHTFNEDTWLPQAQRAYFGSKLSYYPSENWLSTFVVHDDNFGPYYCLPRHFLKQNSFRILFGLKRSATTFTALQAEAIGFAFMDAIVRRIPQTGNDWYDRFSVFTRQGWLVLRTSLVKKEDYLEHAQSTRAWDGTSLEAELHQKLGDCLPPLFWQIEASAPELFASSRRKFGEVLLPCDKPLPTSLNRPFMLATRLPGVLFIQRGEPQLEVFPTNLKSHTPLFTMPTE
jgi:hypothetical protein